MAQDSVKSVSRSSMAFLSGTLISRITGGVRDMVMAFCFGSSSSLAGFMIAYRFANLARRLFGESPVSAGFVPQFEALRSESLTKAIKFFRDTFFSLFFFLLLFLGSLEIILWGIYYFADLTESTKEIVFLSLVMLPGALFMCLFGICSTLLQCQKNFFLPGLAPVAFNIVWIFSVLLLKGKMPSQAVIGLSVAMVLAFFFHWAILLPEILRLVKESVCFKEFFSFKLFSKEVRRILKPFLFGIIGVGAVQINGALDAIFARYASLEGPAYLWYAIRIEQVPVGLFGVALSSALLPSLSRSAAANDMTQYKDFLGYALKKTFSLLFPCTIALIVLGCCGINLVYGRGDFSQQATLETVLCLWGYVIGLLPSVGVMLLAPALYAKHSFKLPTIASIFSVFINVVLNYLFVFYFGWGALSIALATSIAAFVNFGILCYFLRKRIGSFLLKNLIGSGIGGTIICTILAAGMTLFLGHYWADDPTFSILKGDANVAFSRSFIKQFLQAFVLGGFFVLILLSYAFLFNVQDVLRMFGIKKNRSEIVN